MPIICTFGGIIIRMYYQEHEPPHFHAEHQAQTATFDFDGNMLTGQIQSRSTRRTIRRWASTHTAALNANWTRLKRGEQLFQISPEV